MRLDKVDLNLFVVFDALYRERSVTRVAQRLHLTQPAVSNALNRLRQTFDDPLFVRGPRGMQPTPLADGVSADVQQALGLLQNSVGGQHNFEPGDASRVYRVGMNDLAQHLILPGLHRALARDAPGVSVHAFYQGREASVEQLKAGDLDILIDVPQLNTRELEQVQLGSIPYRLAMAADNPLAGKTPGISDYLGAEHVHVSSRVRGRGQVDLALHNQGQRRMVKMRVQHYAVAATMTATSDLLWTAPTSALKQLELVVVDLPFEVEALVLNLYWHRSADQDPANIWMRDLLQQEFESGLLNVAGSGA